MRVFLVMGRVANTPQPWIFERRFSIMHRNSTGVRCPPASEASA
jgi:hypothetical protein